MKASKILELWRLMCQELRTWKRTALVLLVFSILGNLVQVVIIVSLEKSSKKTEAQLVLAEASRDRARESLEELSRQVNQDQQARSVQAAAYEAIGDWIYIGECTITAYCPCELCCGRWADGVTSSGLPAEPGVVAVDPEVIPLGSTVIIDGQRYLAADTGVTGAHVDVYMSDHQSTVVFGVQRMDVWVDAEESW